MAMTYVLYLSLSTSSKFFNDFFWIKKSNFWNAENLGKATSGSYFSNQKYG